MSVLKVHHDALGCWNSCPFSLIFSLKNFVLYVSTHIFRQKLFTFLFSLPFINGRVDSHKIKKLVCIALVCGATNKHNPLISE